MVERDPMRKIRWLKTYLYIFGMANIATSFTVPLVFGDVLLWQPRNLATDLMVGSIYLAMGIGMLCIAKDPEKQKGFIDFIVLSNILHAAVMIIFAQNWSHLLLDAGFIGLMGVLPLTMYPWGVKRFLQYS